MSNSRFVRAFEPLDDAEIALVHTLLDGTDFRYYIENEHFFHTGGILSHGASEVWVMVEQQDALEVAHLLTTHMGRG
ncbi:MAG: hypothetical protein AMS18_04165 [Gemmatimonas sp. SG8_17]|nr:MAG: hypothetical protein AMS18_04165 [Gemmatimonas sp. SG8_17]